MASSVRGASVVRYLLAAPFVAASAAAAFGASGGAGASIADAAEGARLRVIVKLAAPSGDAMAIAAAATHEAGVPVSYAASVDATRHALVLHCADRAACDSALGRLRQSARYSAVELDGRKSRMN